jgi:HAD superfamily hydrolase (TIGR01509 family)
MTGDHRGKFINTRGRRSRKEWRVIHALVFDFDGLLVDTETPAHESWLEIYREYGQDFPLFQWSVVLGGSGTEFDPAVYLAQRIGQPLEAEAIAARRRRRKEELAAVQPLMPGVAAYLDDAARLGLRLGVASSSPRAWVASHLHRLGVAGRFESIVTADDVARVKPAPDLYLAAVSALGVQPQQAIALEDAPNGLLAAKRAGLLAVAVPTPLTERLPLDDADLRITLLADMPLEALLETLHAATARVAADNSVGA